MAYLKHNWASKEVITANKLNHMEQGVELLDNQIIIAQILTDGTSVFLDKTWKEIYNVINNNKGVCFLLSGYSDNYEAGAEYLLVRQWMGDSEGGQLSSSPSGPFFVADTANDYPTITNVH